MPEPSGARREQIVIQSSTASADSGGQPIKSWSTLATVWARAEYLTGRESEGMSKINAATNMKFTVNYRTDVTPAMRISWRSKFWNIEAVLPGEDKFDMRLLASKVE